MHRFVYFLIGLLVLAFVAGWFVRAETERDRLYALFDEAWEFQKREDPLFATAVGDHRYNDRLPSMDSADIERRAEAIRGFLERLRTIRRDRLAPGDRINYDIFERQMRDRLNEFRFKTYLMPINSRSGFHISFPELPQRVPLNTVKDYENYIARLRAFKTYTEQHIALMREGIRTGYVLPRVVLTGYDKSIRDHIVDDPTRSLLYRPFEKFPDRIPESERERLRAAGRDAIATSVVPAYREFLAFMENEYLPATRATIAASDLPDGRAFYEYRVRHFTTLDVTPEEVHQIGMREVARIRAEMEAIIQRVGFKGSFADFLAYLRTEPRFYVDTPEELLRYASFIAKKMDGELPRLFRRLPRMPYGIKPIPAYIAPKTTSAYYSRPAGDGTRAGTYYVNTYDLKSRPLYEYEALTLHEAVPGHHLQIALAQELEGVPPFRRFLGFSAFSEGWALYAERLGLEVGFYRDPYSNFGRLTFEMWRACRLVVDTGIHALGWSRQRAIDFMAENTALTLLNITNEVDRYISWPGQALAYKMGELKIRELRARAERELGDRFDLRAFHDVVLRNGAVPLPILEQQVEAWIAEQKKAA